MNPVNAKALKRGIRLRLTASENPRGKVWVYLIGALLLILYLLPIYVLLNMSFRTIQDVGSKLALPQLWNVKNYIDVIFNSDLWIGFKNSTLLMVGTVAVEIFISALGAYGLVRGSGKISSMLRSVNMGIMMIPGLALLVGTYSLMVDLHMTNTIWGLVLLSAAGGIPGTMFMYMNFVAAIPNALDEAAAIDGAGTFRTFWTIILPQLKAITVTRIIIAATASWNNYLMPMYLLQSKEKYTVILVIKAAFSRFNGISDFPKACATCALGLLPVILLYLFLQKYIIEGQIDSAVK